MGCFEAAYGTSPQREPSVLTAKPPYPTTHCTKLGHYSDLESLNKTDSIAKGWSEKGSVEDSSLNGCLKLGVKVVPGWSCGPFLVKTEKNHKEEHIRGQAACVPGAKLLHTVHRHRLLNTLAAEQRASLEQALHTAQAEAAAAREATKTAEDAVEMLRGEVKRLQHTAQVRGFGR
eukprot:1153025-Pelagomonas_calceolata.AAC.6